MKSIVMTLVAAAAFTAFSEGMWSGLSADAHVMGPVITEADLLGKVVLVDTTFESRIGQIWESFKTKKFATVGSVRVSGKIPPGLTYPVYKKFGLASGDPNTKMFVVNHRGRVVYAGSSDRDATEAIVNALGQVGAPLSLTTGVPLKNYKSLEKKLQLGKNIKNDVKALESAVKKADGKSASKVDREKGAEARKILRAIADGKADAQREIEIEMRSNPEAAVKTIKEFAVTFPEEGKEYQDRLPELAEKAKEFAAARKAAAAAAKAAKGKK